MKRPASLVAALFLAAVALAHLLRILLDATISVNGTPVPMWVSFPAFLVIGLLAAWLFRERRAHGGT